MSKLKKCTNSYDYIQDCINGVINHFRYVDFNVTAIKEVKIKENSIGLPPFSRKFLYESGLFPFMKSFDQESFLKGFAKATDDKRLEFLDKPENSKSLQYIVWLAEHSERVITDIKAVKADFESAGFSSQNDLENEIRMQAKLYKPFFEILKCMSDINRYKKGDSPFVQTKLTGYEGQAKGHYTDEIVGVDVSTITVDKTDALKRKNNIKEKIYQEGNTKLVSEAKINKQIDQYASQTEEGYKYLRQHQRIKALDPEAGFDIDKDAFQKEHLNKLCAAIKETDPKNVLSNTKEFKQMRDFLYSFTKNYDNLNPKQRQLAGKELKKLTNNYITPRVKRYEDEMKRFPNEREYMNERSRTRFELAQKLSVLCDIVSTDYAPLPKHAQPDNPERFKHYSVDTASRANFVNNRPFLPEDGSNTIPIGRRALKAQKEKAQNAQNAQKDQNAPKAQKAQKAQSL